MVFTLRENGLASAPSQQTQLRQGLNTASEMTEASLTTGIIAPKRFTEAETKTLTPGITMTKAKTTMRTKDKIGIRQKRSIRSPFGSVSLS